MIRKEDKIQTRMSLKEIRKREAEREEKELREKCEALAVKRYGKETVVNLSNKFKGIWFLPAINEATGEIEKLALMQPITRSILSYASTKIQDGGLYEYLEAAMRLCVIEEGGVKYYDEELLEDDEYFLPAANAFNKIAEGKKVALLKR